MNRKIIFAFLVIIILIFGCKPADDGGRTGGGSMTEETDSLPSVDEADFTIESMDWKSKNCRLAEDECEKRNEGWNAACTRVIYSADAEMLCHLYINRKLRIDDPTSEEYANIGRTYKFSPNVQVLELKDDNLAFFYDTEIRWCCAGAIEKLRDKNYDFCKELKLIKLCP